MKEECLEAQKKGGGGRGREREREQENRHSLTQHTHISRTLKCTGDVHVCKKKLLYSRASKMQCAPG